MKHFLITYAFYTFYTIINKAWRVKVFSISGHHKCVSSFCFIWIPMLCVYGHYIFANSFSGEIVFRRQNLTSTDVIFWRLKWYNLFSIYLLWVCTTLLQSYMLLNGDLALAARVHLRFTEIWVWIIMLESFLFLNGSLVSWRYPPPPSSPLYPAVLLCVRSTQMAPQGHNMSRRGRRIEQSGAFIIVRIITLSGTKSQE